MRGRIILHKVSVVYNKRAGSSKVLALSDISLLVNPGELVCVVGENGSGKSTLLKVLHGSIEFDTGSVWVNGFRAKSAELPNRSIRDVLLLGRDGRSFCVPNLTVAQNLALAYRRSAQTLFTREPNAATLAALQTTALQLLEGVETQLHSRFTLLVSELSDGECQLLALLIAAMASPAVLLLDEHTGSLSPQNRLAVNAITRRIAQTQRTTIVMVSHLLSEARQISDRMIVLSEGKKRDDIWKYRLSELNDEVLNNVVFN